MLATDPIHELFFVGFAIKLRYLTDVSNWSWMNNVMHSEFLSVGVWRENCDTKHEIIYWARKDVEEI